MKKRFLTLALVLAMCLSLAVPAFAAANSTAKPEDTDPVATESAEPEDKDPEASDSAGPEDKDAEASDSAGPEDKDPEASDSAGPEDKDPEPSDSAEPEDKEPEPSEPAAPEFTDVPDAAFCAAAVKWAVEKNITNGTSTTKFSPDENCTQAQILTFLYRAAREDGKTASAEDMELAVEWAKEKGIIDGSFEAGKDCTRSTAVSYIWQAFESPEAEAASFADVDAEADYAAAVSWALANGVTNGTSEADNTFGPDEVCNRGQIVTFLHRAYVEEARLTAAE